MALRLSRLISPKRWRAAFRAIPVYFSALKAYEQRDDETALRQFEEFLNLVPTSVADYMAFYGTLLILNNRSAEAKPVFEEILRGKFRNPAKPEVRYAKMYSHYYLALMSRRQDVVERWLEAKRHSPQKGFAAKYLVLPDNPLPV